MPGPMLCLPLGEDRLRRSGVSEAGPRGRDRQSPACHWRWLSKLGFGK